MKGVEQVERTGDRLHWVADAVRGTNERNAEITAEQPGERIAWRAPDGPIDTEIVFEALGPDQTRVIFREHMHDSLLAQAAVKSGYAGRRAVQDLERYKELVEATPDSGSATARV